MRLIRVVGSVADLHARLVPEDLGEAELWVLEPSVPALVLGNGQAEAVADREAATAAAVDVVRRPSGGGAVFVDRERCLWLDVVLPRDDVRWDDDVRASPLWLGEAWRRALAVVGLDAKLYDGGLEKTQWARLVCFAAVGPGELLINGQKVVGISQRRTLKWARFQCVVYDRWDPREVLALLDLPDAEVARGAAELVRVATGVGDRLPLLREAILAELLG